MEKNRIAMLFMAIVMVPGTAWNQENGPAAQEGEALSLPKAVQLALSQNPDLKAVAANRQIAEADRLQAGLMPNPDVEAELENFSGSGSLSGFDAAETTVFVGQLLETAGKRRKRQALAGFQESLAQWDYEAKRLDILEETVLAFIDVLAMQQRVSLDHDLYVLAKEVAASVTARVEAGKVSPLEAIKADIAVSNAQMQWLQNQERLKGLRLKLASLWGEDRLRFSHVEGRLDLMVEVPSTEALDTLLLRNPDMARWSTEMDRLKTHLELEKAQRVPDLTLKLGYRDIGGLHERAWVAGFSLPLAIFNRNQGNIQRAGQRINRGEIRKQAEENQKRVQLAATLQSLNTAFEQATILRRQVLPAAEKAFEGTREGYREGKFGYLEVLDAQRTYFEVNIQHIEWLAQYQRHKTVLERLIGQALPGTARDLGEEND